MAGCFSHLRVLILGFESQGKRVMLLQQRLPNGKSTDYYEVRYGYAGKPDVFVGLYLGYQAARNAYEQQLIILGHVVVGGKTAQ